MAIKIFKKKPVKKKVSSKKIIKKKPSLKKRPSSKKTTVKKPTSKKHTGPPTKYNPLYHPTMIRLAAQLGKINSEIAKELGICKRTLQSWKNEYPEVDEALARGKEIPNKIIEQDAFDCAHGYYYIEEYAKFYKGRWHKTVVRKYKPKDPTAVIWWQKNRDPERWKDRHDITINTEKIDEMIESFRGIK